MSGAPAEIVSKLAARGIRHVYVDDGITIQRFLQAGLIPRLIITRVPVLIGAGIPLFGAVPPVFAPAQVSAPAQPRPTAPPARKYVLPLEPRVYETFDQKIRVSVVVHGIGRPWSLLPLPDGNFLVGVRPTGQVLAMHTTFRTGMLDMVMHPTACHTDKPAVAPTQLSTSPTLGESGAACHSDTSTFSVDQVLL